MKRVAFIVLSIILLIWTVQTIAQEATPEATPAVIPVPTSGELLQEGVRIGTTAGEESGILKGAAITLASVLTFLAVGFTLLLRSVVLQNALESWLIGRLTKAQLSRLNQGGVTLIDIGSVIKKISDGLPNDKPPL